MKALLVGVAGPRECGKSTVATMIGDSLYTKSMKCYKTETGGFIHDYIRAHLKQNFIVFDKQDPYIRFLLEQTGVYLRQTDPEFMAKFIQYFYKEGCNKADFIVVAGVRRLNEVAKIRELGGVTVRLYRQTNLPVMPSEDELHNIIGDYVLWNESNLTALENNVEVLVQWLVNLHKTINEKETNDNLPTRSS